MVFQPALQPTLKVIKRLLEAAKLFACGAQHPNRKRITRLDLEAVLALPDGLLVAPGEKGPLSIHAVKNGRERVQREGLAEFVGGPVELSKADEIPRLPSGGRGSSLD